jgi:predicted dehydrogenase
MSKQIRFGVIGAGMISLSGVQSINKHPQATVVAATDPHKGRLDELCAAGNIPQAYPTTEALLADKQIDAVYIAVPNKFHVPLSVQALNAGKHVILDKPFAMNYAEAESAACAARAAGKVLTLGMNQRFAASSQQFRTLVKEGALGEVYHAKASWTRRSGIPKLGTWFGNKELAGGGCLYDIGVHMLDLCL